MLMAENPLIDRVLSRYPHATRLQRWHMRARLSLCPYPALIPHLTGAGSVLDLGCGFGHLAWVLNHARPSLSYYGSDIDSRKIALARGCAIRPGETRPEFLDGDPQAGTPPGWPAGFGNIVLLDVLYLLPWEEQERMLAWALAHLSAAPGSALVLKSMEQAEGVAGFRALAEEWVMVHLLGRTRSSGTIRGAKPASAYRAWAEARGYRCTVEDLGTFNPSYLARIEKVPQAPRAAGSAAPAPGRAADG